MSEHTYLDFSEIKNTLSARSFLSFIEKLEGAARICHDYQRSLGSRWWCPILTAALRAIKEPWCAVPFHNKSAIEDSDFLHAPRVQKKRTYKVHFLFVP